MRIRPMGIEDVVWAAPLAEEAGASMDSGYGHALTRWAADPQVRGWVAESREGRGVLLLGQVGLLGEGRPRVLEVLLLAVEAGARRRGMGRSLLARALQEARSDLGAREVRLTVAEGHQAARSLFQQAGFQVERADDGTFPGGQRAVRMRWLPR